MMFYGQCFICGERWELGTAPTCVCERPSNWVGLTDEEIKSLAQDNIFCDDNFYDIDNGGIVGWNEFARDIEQALKDKNK